MKALLLIFAVLMTHYSYHWIASTPEEASELFYVLRGWEGAILFAMLAALVDSAIARAVCCVGTWEELQTGLCGAGSHFYTVPIDSGLCVEKYGVTPYIGLLAFAILYLWKKRHAWKS